MFSPPPPESASSTQVPSGHSIAVTLTHSSASRAGRIAALGYDYASQPKQAVSSCNLCGASQFVALTHRDRYDYPAQAHACVKCGLVFLNPRMTAEAYGRFYDGVYRPLVSAFHGRLIDARTIQGEQHEYAAERVEFIRPFLGDGGQRTMLDIGGSTGVVAYELARAFGLQGTVIDPAPLETAQAARFGLETITGLVEHHDFGSRQFDVIIICQAVDHLLDVRGTLERVRTLVSDRGIFFIDIVDFRAAYLRNWSVEAAVKIDHPYYLTETTMTTFLRRTGFEILRADYAADHLHVGYVCRPGTAAEGALPEPASVTELLREVRYVQNTPRPGLSAVDGP
jgi:2-polyprenyl-3-methyl-5-hydroxy-6-metoxy-1,4-benzoquinol methylase